jgi:6-phosphofructokinase 1
MMRSEHAHPLYTTNFMATLFAGAGGDLFDVRQAILGHLQQGGNPSPFDRILAMRFASTCIERLILEAEQPNPAGVFVGLQAGQVEFHNLEDLPRMKDPVRQRPREQWWLEVRSIAKVLTRPGPSTAADFLG